MWEVLIRDGNDYMKDGHQYDEVSDLNGKDCYG